MSFAKVIFILGQIRRCRGSKRRTIHGVWEFVPVLFVIVEIVSYQAQRIGGDEGIRPFSPLLESRQICLAILRTVFF